MIQKIAEIQYTENEKKAIELMGLSISFYPTDDLPMLYYPLENRNIKWIAHVDRDKLTEIQKRVHRYGDLWNKNQQAGINCFNW